MEEEEEEGRKNRDKEERKRKEELKKQGEKDKEKSSSFIAPTEFERDLEEGLREEGESCMKVTTQGVKAIA